MITPKATNAVWARIDKADARYGNFASTHEAMGVALEEWDEFKLAIHANDAAAVQHEALDLIAVLFRLHDQLDTVQRLRERSSMEPA